MLFKEWLPEWLSTYIKPTLKLRTYNRYYEIVYQHIIPRLGEYEIEEITTYKLQSFVADLMQNGNLKNGQGLSTNSVNSIITVIQNSLKTACVLGFTDEYNGNKIKRPKNSERKVECFSLEEQRKIEEYIINNDDCGMYFGIILSLYTGIRIGELMALEWTDIDLDRRLLRITKSCYYCKNDEGRYCRTTDIPKTAASIRIIPIPKQIVPYIEKINKKSLSKLIVSKDEKEISTRSYQRRFSKLLEKLHIQHKGFHSLRHTFATRAIECGVDARTLSEILGHTSTTVTLNRYVHSLLEHKMIMADKIGERFNCVTN